jgi:hypothetical protein
MTVSILTPVAFLDGAHRPSRDDESDSVDMTVRSSQGIALIDNSKLGSDRMLALVGSEIAVKDIDQVSMIRKSSAGISVSPADVGHVLANARAVVCGVGDCGACTACSVDDAVIFAKLGMPTAVILTEPFLKLANMLLAPHGDLAIELCVVEHPFFSKDDDWFNKTSQDLGEKLRAVFG